MYLIGTGEISRAVSRYYQRSSTLAENWILLCVFLAIVAFWIVLVYWDRLCLRLLPNHRRPDSLFQELCAAHRLNRGQRMLLIKAAHSGQIGCAAVLFVEPAILERLAGGEARDADSYRELLVRLFGSTELPED